MELSPGVVLERGDLAQDDEELAGRVEALKESLEEGGSQGVGGNSGGKDRLEEVGVGVAMSFGREEDTGGARGGKEAVGKVIHTQSEWSSR